MRFFFLVEHQHTTVPGYAMSNYYYELLLSRRWSKQCHHQYQNMAKKYYPFIDLCNSLFLVFKTFFIMFIKKILHLGISIIYTWKIPSVDYSSIKIQFNLQYFLLFSCHSDVQKLMCK